MKTVQKIAMASIAFSLTASINPSYAQNPTEQLVVVTTGGAFEDALRRFFYEPFTETTGATINSVAAFTSDQFVKMHAMARVGQVEYDVVTAQPENFVKDIDVLEKLDCSKIPNAETYGVPGTCGEYGMFRTIGGGVIAYRTDAFPSGGPNDWKDFFDTVNYPGPRCMNGIEPHWMIMAALMADGVDSKALFPLDIERGIAKLEAIKSDVTVWWTTGNESQSSIRQGECVASWMWSGRALELVNSGEPIEISWKQHLPIIAYWAIAKNAPNRDLAYEFLNFFMERPDAHLEFSNAVVYDTSNKLATAQLPPEELKNRSTAAENLAEQVPTDFEWIATHMETSKNLPISPVS